ncbi:unnamed protein product [Acanthoscelides obtectus]|uniref:DDE Tnp4 domain-containing protein n=1 Tax=Acanthoscelides obtectus TaxID=200917 RepID=A0A9P0LA34_ACAOB|nr:unnamed protein product [Acanthoscelides obtectus]CAK1646652.1 hypothetical protein AOBTE_LOCUS14787 [Acanthoscelides obtectus]
MTYNVPINTSPNFQAQVVCDHKRKIKDIFVGHPGSVHDSRVFLTSPLFGTHQEKCGNHFLIGDSVPPALEAQNVIVGQAGRDAGNENQDEQTGITKRNEVMNSLDFVI